MSNKTHVTCTINGDEVDFLTEDGESLLNALRDEVAGPMPDAASGP